MLILSRVCADFYDKNRKQIHRITQEDLGHFRDVPEEIRQDPLFQMLLDDGSIKFPPDDAKEKLALENNPMAGADASGREIVKPKTEPRTPAKTKAGSKTDSKAESKDHVKTEAKTEEKSADIK